MGRAEPRTSSRKMKTKKKSYARRGCGGGCSRKTKQKKHVQGKGKIYKQRRKTEHNYKTTTSKQGPQDGRPDFPS